MRASHRDERLRQRAEQALAGFAGLPGWKRQVLARFLVESARGWHTYLHRSFPRTGRPDALLIGPKGVLAVLLREQAPEEGELPSFRFAAELFLGARVREGNVSDAVVRPVVVFPPEHRPARGAGYLAVSAAELDRVLDRGERRLDRRDVRALAAHLESGNGDYVVQTLGEEQEAEAGSEQLFDVAEIRQDRFDRALAGSFESWLTFLDDSQFAMVRRNYQGPARISGPAGTGKSVVALHRMAHLAKRTTGRLLFTAHAKNLPPIMERNFSRLVPELAERAEFRSLHSWALQLLRDRGRDIEVSSSDSVFGPAWSRSGKQSKLNELNPNPSYWRDEIDHVIKGRGLTGPAEYQAVRRTGRGLPLDRSDRELVWHFFQQYEAIRVEKGQHDFNDLLSEALHEVERDPLQPGYAAVVVDEVQDITLLGLRLLRAIAGDGPNRLLLVGDGQQQIYPGGWRLSDAGIPIRGRGEVLRNNYRNASRVLELAKRFDATNQVDDLDGDVGVSLRESVATFRGGQADIWRGPRADHERALLAALGELGEVPRDDIAVLTFDRRAAGRWLGVLRRAGFDAMDLEHFEGERTERIKVGTVYRAKGLEFRAVLVPEPPRTEPDGDRGREWRERGQRAQLVAATRGRDHVWVGFPA
ncbi:AAA family ATPase [Saccharopolyspora erythraea]|uniref:UvrD-helicase domain-containing protein n=1 Tax=Saccharopolyspora erythraea TaxID=1836 RepID=UPI001BA7BAF8|nr:UvrD-helicase domain-containing protein [Saccharopolyspora erythraea]QUH00381.1 AAA family ATPase [Saccharopolyspora erythraea]